MSPSFAQNQTDALTPLQFGNIPFQIEIEQVQIDYTGLPGLHSGATCVVQGESDLLFMVAGRANEAGMHGFNCPGESNFAVDAFNRSLYVVDVNTGEVWGRSVDDPSSGLTSLQADQVASVNCLYNQLGDYLIMVGGYGYSSDVDDWVTFDKLVLFELSGCVDWVMGGKKPLVDSMQFLSPPTGAPEDLYTVTGGISLVVEDELWICLGQEFQGVYSPCDEDAAMQIYKKDFFRLALTVGEGDSFPSFSYLGNSPQKGASWSRRRDLNVFPAYLDDSGTRGCVGLAGVFTLDDGGWTVPIVMHPDGTMEQPPVDAPATLRQGFNMYNAPRFSAWSEKTGDNWFIIGGGIGYQFFLDGNLQTNSYLPYSSTLSAIQYTPADGRWAQHLLGSSYPRIPVPDSDEYFRFGAQAYAFPAGGHWIDGRILDLDSIQEPTLIGLIYGGLMVAGYTEPTGGGPNQASNYMFAVTLIPGEGCTADFDGGGQVDGEDLLTMLSQWGELPLGTTSNQDLNDDGYINAVDLSILLGEWGPCPVGK